jgi:HbrB-like
MPGLTASQIAAQAAYQHLNAGKIPDHNRKRSQTFPHPEQQAQLDTRRNSKGSATSSQDETTPPDRPQYRNGLVGTNAATTAASVAYPKNPASQSMTSLVEEKEPKKGLKRFRPKNITLSRDKDKDGKDKPLPSPNKPQPSGLSKVMNASTTSLAESLSSNNSSLYALANPSQSTIIPVSEAKEKSHKHHGLRQKLKLKDKDDHPLPLSSAHSTSRPVDINNPQSFYNFAPSSPNTSSFSKSVSGLDLRHGGRALREKKKEEKAQAQAALEPVLSRESDTSEWPALGASFTNSSATYAPYSNNELHSILSGFGLNNMTADDAWDFLKAKLLNVFEGEEVKVAVEDLNRLVTIHVQRCVQKRDPSIIVGDLEDLLQTGFMSLNHTLGQIPDEQLVPHLVSMWLSVFGYILPFMQAVFLPLDQEFKGRGTVLTTQKMAAEFWGHIPSNNPNNFSTSPGYAEEDVVAAGEELEIRRILLISYRDVVILPRFDPLKATFSRLSLDSINATLAHLESTGRTRGSSDGSDRPSTARSLDPGFASYNSQASTLLASGGRSRATSNLSTTSNPAQDVAFQSFSSPPAARPTDSTSSQVTETVGRMLQCLSVLCSVQTGDEAQTKMEELNKQLKLNWLGRGRTGRNRKGFVGTRIRPVRSVASTIRGQDRDGSPTPTPTRQGTVSRQGDDSSRGERSAS